MNEIAYPLKAGDNVRIPNSGVTGTVVKISRDRKRCRVKWGHRERTFEMRTLVKVA